MIGHHCKHRKRSVRPTAGAGMSRVSLKVSSAARAPASLFGSKGNANRRPVGPPRGLAHTDKLICVCASCPRRWSSTASSDPTGPRKVLVTGAGGFIGHHLVRRLKATGHWVRGCDIKKPEYEPTPADEFVLLDLRHFESCARALTGVQDVYQLASDMGGIGYISGNHWQISRNNVLINANMLQAACIAPVQRYLYASSACVYPAFRQASVEVAPLREESAIPAEPEKGYGWEKLFSEQLATYAHEDQGLDVRIPRFHNIYGPLGAFDGGREKAPAAICRKVSEAEDGGELEVWGDGRQTRSFCYIDDCVEGLLRLMDSGYTKPINLGSEEIVTVDRLVDLVCQVARKKLSKRHDLSKSQGVRGRNSDNTNMRTVLGWEPRTSLEQGIRRTYPWVWQQLQRQGRARNPAPISTPLATSAVSAP